MWHLHYITYALFLLSKNFTPLCTSFIDNKSCYNKAFAWNNSDSEIRQEQEDILVCERHVNIPVSTNRPNDIESSFYVYKAGETWGLS